MIYVIGIGGTGAKCIEAFVHLAAAGLAPDEEVYAFFVDPDEANGTLERAHATLKRYVKSHALELGTIDLFRTKITITDPAVWSPFQHDGRDRLGAFFSYQHLKDTDPAAAHLMDVLFTPDEREEKLTEGFLGHPSIGAAVLGQTIDIAGGREPWATFEAKLGKGAKIFLFGSIFGGTGAAGLPTIARLIDRHLTKIGLAGVPIGAAMMLPYFSFEPERGRKLKADANSFSLNTHAALKYYYSGSYLNVFKAAYFLGERRQAPMGNPSLGGKDQNNEPHFLELYAALAALDFFANPKPGPCAMIARGEDGGISWDDIPGGESVRRKLGQLARFAVSFKYMYREHLADIDKNGKAYRAPWYGNYFINRQVPLSQVSAELDAVQEYSEDYLKWLGTLHESTGLDTNLINWHVFSHRAGDKTSHVRLLPRADTTEFSRMVLPANRGEGLGFGELWEHMCRSRVEDPNTNGVGRFVHALYRECGAGLGIKTNRAGR